MSGAITDHPKIDALFLTTVTIFLGLHNLILIYLLTFAAHRLPLPRPDDPVSRLLVIRHCLHHVWPLPLCLACCDLILPGEPIY